MTKEYINSFIIVTDKTDGNNDVVLSANDVFLSDLNILPPSANATNPTSPKGPSKRAANDAIIGLNIFQNLEIPLAGQTYDQKTLIFLKKEEHRTDFREFKLPNKTINYPERIRNTVNSKSIFCSNTLYFLIQGALDVEFPGETLLTYNAEDLSTWRSTTLSIERNKDCTVKLHSNTVLVCVQFRDSMENYDAEYIKFNGILEKPLSGDSKVLAQKISKGNNRSVLVNGNLSSYFVSCNGTLTLDSTDNSFSIIIKSK